MRNRSLLRLLGVLALAIAAASVLGSAATAHPDGKWKKLHIDAMFTTVLDLDGSPECPLPYLLANGTGTAGGTVLKHNATATAVECSLPVGAEIFVDGMGTFTTKKGDQLFIEYDETSGFPIFDVFGNATIYDAGTFTVVGGTGRFEGATGGGDISAVVTIVGFSSATAVAVYDGKIMLDDKKDKDKKH